MTRRVACITGGAQGIGRAICERLLADGCAVVFLDLDDEAGAETAEALGRLGPIQFVAGDSADDEACRRLVATAVEDFGGLDILVNNTGIMVARPVTELPIEAWRRVLDVNLTSIFLTTRHAAPHLQARRGAIVNIASTRALMSEPNTEAYAASKGGVVALTHALAVSLGPAVRVNCITPGWIDTSSWRKAATRVPAVLSVEDHAQHPCGRVGRPEDIANLAAFLTGPDSGFITGANHVVDGGMTRRMLYVD